MACVGLIKSQIKPDDDFVCKKCKKVPVEPPQNTPPAKNNGTTTSKKTNASNAKSDRNSINNSAATTKRKSLMRSKDEKPDSMIIDSAADNAKENEPKQIAVEKMDH